MFLGKLRLVIVTVIITTTLLAIGFFYIRSKIEKPEARVDLSRPSVIKEIRSLGNLETASYSIEKIVEAGEDRGKLEELLFGDKLLLIANGKVVAGVDLTQVSEKDILVEGDALSVSLPAPVILSSNLDNSQTKVYDRSQGYLNRGDKDLETAARKSAEEAITKAACEAGILIEARDNAVKRIKQLFEFSGFTKVSVTVPHGSC